MEAVRINTCATHFELCDVLSQTLARARLVLSVQVWFWFMAARWSKTELVLLLCQRSTSLMNKSTRLLKTPQNINTVVWWRASDHSCWGIRCEMRTTTETYSLFLLFCYLLISLSETRGLMHLPKHNGKNRIISGGFKTGDLLPLIRDTICKG